MFWIIALTILTYSRMFWNKFISDDITVNSELSKKGYPIRWREYLTKNPLMIIHDIQWKLFKDKPLPHHIINLLLYIGLNCSFYFVGKRYLPQEVAFLATLIFAVHPCNAQVAGWISGKFYMVAAILGLWALYFNNIIPYLFSSFCHPIMFLLPMIMKIPLWEKFASIFLTLYLFLFYSVGSKIAQINSEGEFKKDHLGIYPRKLIVMLKSFAYYFCLALFPIKLGWFHEIGEPIDDKLKSFNFHAVLAILLLGAFALFWKIPAFLGLFLFGLFILPFANFVTPALFTSERYMTPAIMGVSIFLAFILIHYPIIAAVLITVYFMRTQLELWAYQDDFHLALYSLLNFNKSGFAWCNMAHYFLASGRPSAAFDLLKETERKLPTFPTVYWQLYLMNRSVDLLNNFDEALKYLEKACHYGKHEGWYQELDGFKNKLKNERIKRFKENVARNKFTREFRPNIAPSLAEPEQVLVGHTS